jgi:protein involved in sex pheromone biosynthesis
MLIKLYLAESTHGDHKNELTSFIQFEELLQKYFDNSDHFTVVPKIVFLDADVHALNSFLMRDRPGKEFFIEKSDFMTFKHFQYLLPLNRARFCSHETE